MKKLRNSLNIEFLAVQLAINCVVIRQMLSLHLFTFDELIWNCKHYKSTSNYLKHQVDPNFGLTFVYEHCVAISIIHCHDSLRHEKDISDRRKVRVEVLIFVESFVKAVPCHIEYVDSNESMVDCVCPNFSHF